MNSLTSPQRSSKNDNESGKALDPLITLKDFDIMAGWYGEGIRKVETTNDPQDKIANGAIKYDAGKAPINRGALSYFPRAIELVAAISAFGATKYAWRGWEGVDDGINRYSDAMVRHLVAEGKGEVLDPDSGLLHAGHVAWGALARLELMLREMEKE